MAAALGLAGCVSPSEPLTDPAPTETPPLLVVGDVQGELLQEWILDGERREVNIGATAEISLAHEAAAGRSFRVSIERFHFFLDTDAGESGVVVDGWRTPLGSSGPAVSMRLADGETRASELAREADASGCDRIEIATRWEASGQFHAISEEVEFTICPDGQLDSWSSATVFPTGSRRVRWSRDSG